MALQTTGAISLGNVNTELGNASTATISLNDAVVRALFGVASGSISLSDGYGKSNALDIGYVRPTSNAISWYATVDSGGGQKHWAFDIPHSAPLYSDGYQMGFVKEKTTDRICLASGYFNKHKASLYFQESSTVTVIEMTNYLPMVTYHDFINNLAAPNIYDNSITQYKNFSLSEEVKLVDIGSPLRTVPSDVVNLFGSNVSTTGVTAGWYESAGFSPFFTALDVNTFNLSNFVLQDSTVAMPHDNGISVPSFQKHAIAYIDGFNLVSNGFVLSYESLAGSSDNYGNVTADRNQYSVGGVIGNKHYHSIVEVNHSVTTAVLSWSALQTLIAADPVRANLNLYEEYDLENRRKRWVTQTGVLRPWTNLYLETPAGQHVSGLYFP